MISSKYKLIPGDLRKVDINDLLEPYKNKDDPTIIISECVFVYMSIDSTNKILESFSREFKESLVIIYEMTNLDDKFGKVMISNLKVCKYSIILSPKYVLVKRNWITWVNEWSIR